MALPGDPYPPPAALQPWLAGLPDVLPRQRWFGATGGIAAVRLRDHTWLTPDAALALVEVELATGERRLYQLASDDFAAPRTRARLLELLATSATLPGERGAFLFELLDPERGGDLERLATGGASQIGRAEQSNSSILYGGGRAGALHQWVYKAFRRLSQGMNPELEIPWALARHSGFRNLALPAAQASYTTRGEAYTLGVLQPFIANQGDGWEWALRELRAARDPRTLEPELALLGRRTAELHLALSALVEEPDFAPEPIRHVDVEDWSGRLRLQARSRAEEMRRQGLAPELAEKLERLQPERFRLEPLTEVLKIRHHGDYHLGQVLKTEDDFIILDFEGEPARNLAERRQRACVLKDVAGMLRSFSYASYAAGAPPAWEENARQAFWSSYETTLRHAPPALLPPSAGDCRRALDFFECEKAVYELGYEMQHRPSWVGLPLAGLERLLRGPG